MIIGIDNGLDGGIVAVSTESGAVYIKEVMPTIGTKGKGRRMYDLGTILKILTNTKLGKEKRHVFLERAQPMPGNGSLASFSMGYCFGLMQMACVALKIPYTIIGPREWQKEMFQGINKTDTKQASALIAGRLAPDEDWRASERCRRPHDGLTDAYCIAEFGRRKLNNI